MSRFLLLLLLGVLLLAHLSTHIEATQKGDGNFFMDKMRAWYQRIRTPVHPTIAFLQKVASKDVVGLLHRIPKFSQFSSLSRPKEIPKLAPIGIEHQDGRTISMESWEEYDYATNDFIPHDKEDTGQPLNIRMDPQAINAVHNGQWATGAVSYYSEYRYRTAEVWIHCQKQDDDSIRQGVKDATRAHADVYARLERATKGSIFEKHLPLIKDHDYFAWIFKLDGQSCVSVLKTPGVLHVSSGSLFAKARIVGFLRFLRDIKLMHWYQHSGLLLRHHPFDPRGDLDRTEIPRNAAALPNFYYNEKPDTIYHNHAWHIIKEAARRAAAFGVLSDNLILKHNSKIDMNNWPMDVIQHSYLKLANAKGDISPNEVVERVLEIAKYRHPIVLRIDPFDEFFYSLRMADQLKDLELARKAIIHVYNIPKTIFSAIGPATTIKSNGAGHKRRPLPNEISNHINRYVFNAPGDPTADIFYRIAGLEEPPTNAQLGFARLLVEPVTQAQVDIWQQQSVDNGLEATTRANIKKALAMLQSKPWVQRLLATRIKPLGKN